MKGVKLGLISIALFLICVFILAPAEASDFRTATSLEDMKTPAEADGFKEITTLSKDVLDFCRKVASLSNGRVRVDHIGWSPMGKEMIVMVFGNPAPKGPEEVKPDQVVCYMNTNIHPGEVEGKEAALILAREVAQGKHDELLKDVVVVINPNMSVDGNDLLGENRIDSQPEPRLVGTRNTAQGLNLNRDFTKLDQPETIAVMKVLKKWQPALMLDAHATDGSFIRHALTYHCSYDANTDDDLLKYNLETFIPAVMGPGSMLDTKYHRTVRPYGNFLPDGGAWDDNPAFGNWSLDSTLDLPRYAFNYVGLRKMVSVLLECYSRDPYKTRVETQYACMYGTIKALAERKDEVKNIVKAVNDKETDREKNGLNGEEIVLETKLRFEEPFDYISIDSYVYESQDINGRVKAIANTDKPITYKMRYIHKYDPVGSICLPAYYFIPAGFFNAVDKLLLHDIKVYRLNKDIEIDVKEYGNFDIESQPFYEGHARHMFRKGTWTESKRKILQGTYVVSTSQRNGKLAGILLEPEAEDGLASWNFFDSGMPMAERYKSARVYPVLKSGTDYSVVDKSAMEEVLSTPLDWAPVESTGSPEDDGGSGGCALGFGALALLALVPFISRRKK